MRVHARKQAGFTLWELIVVICLVVFLFAISLENLLPLRGAAERAQVLHTEGALRSALGLQATERVIRSGAPGLRQLTSENPLDWLAIRPNTADAKSLETMPAGHWAWFSQGNILAYRLRYPQYVENAFADEWLRYRVKLSEDASRQPANLSLLALDPARWKLPHDVTREVREGIGGNNDDGST